MRAPRGVRRMGSLLEYVGNVHIFLGPYRGNPIALYLRRNGDRCVISPKVYPWNVVVGEGETPNKAAADFEEKWKTKGLSQEMYSGPSWEGGIKPEKPAPPKPAAPGAAATAAKPAGAETPLATPKSQIAGAPATAEKPEAKVMGAVISPAAKTLGTESGVSPRTPEAPPPPPQAATVESPEKPEKTEQPTSTTVSSESPVPPEPSGH